MGASPAAAAKAAGDASAFAPAGGQDTDALPGTVKANGKPVRLHGTAEDKSAPTARGRRGAKVVAKAPAEEADPQPPVKPGKGKSAAGKGKGKVKSASHRKAKTKRG